MPSSCSRTFCRILLVLLLVLPWTAWAQDRSDASGTRTLSGVVRDAETGESLPYATVEVLGTSTGAATNLDGRFVLTGVSTTTVRLRTRHIGFVPDTLTVAPDATMPLDIALRPDMVELDGVTVTAETYEIMESAVAPSVVTMSPQALEALPAIGEIDIFRSLQLLPGISATQGGSGLYVRGGTPDENLVLFDGMTAYHVDHFFGFFSAFNARAVKDVRVYKSAYPARYGGRTSSVVELTGKAGDTSGYSGGASLNLLSGSAALEGPIGDRASFLVTGRRSYTDVLQTDLYESIFQSTTGDDPDATSPGPGGSLGGGLQNRNQATVTPDFYFYDVNAKLTYRPTDLDILALSLYNGQDHLDESRSLERTLGIGEPVGTQRSDVDDVTDWGNLGSSVKWSRQWHPRVYTNAIVSYAEYFSEYDRRDFIEIYDAETDTLAFSAETSSVEDNRVSDLTARLDTEWKASDRHTIAWGVQATRSDVEYTFTRNDTLGILSEDEQALTLATYAEDTWASLDRLEITAGVRASYYDVTGDTYVDPRLSLTVSATDRLRLKAAYGQHHQFTTRVISENVTEGARDFWLLADDDLVNVRGATHYVLGASYETDTWLLDAEAYYRDLSGLSEFSLRFQRGQEAPEQLFFVGDGMARGVELLAQKKFGSYNGWLSYTLGHVEHTFPALNDGEAFPALHDTRHEVKLVNTLRLSDRWKASATWTFGSGQPYTEPESVYTLTLLDGTEESYIHVGDKNGERLPAYHRLDVGVNYRFPLGTSEVDLGLSVYNLYDHDNVQYREFDTSADPILTTDVTYLGVTPNVSVRVDF